MDLGRSVSTQKEEPKMNESWRKFFSLAFGSPRRALVSIAVIVVIIWTGVIGALARAFEVNVFWPLAYVVILIGILFFLQGLLWHGGKRKK
jgi:hypothetical protein